MASLKLALATIALSVAILSSVVASETAQAANPDGGYQKFPSRFRRDDGVPQVPQVPSGVPDMGQYGNQFQEYMKPDKYQEYMKPDKYSEYAKPISQYVQRPINGKPNNNSNRPEPPQTEKVDDDETNCS